MMTTTRILTVLMIAIFHVGTGASRTLASDNELVLRGKTMGTTYQVKITPIPEIPPNHIQARIDQRLAEINQSMSLYLADSEINRVNAADADRVLIVSRDLWQVLQTAKQLHRMTAGALDPTVGPLVALWGFGRGTPRNKVPEAGDIEAVLSKVGYNHIALFAEQRLRKRLAAVTLDLGAIAKGYGVDQVSAVVAALPASNFLVEIGGEVFARGLSGRGQPWRVGINRPEKGGPFDAVHAVVALDGRCLATSGDYRQFFKLEGKAYSHVIDPATGRPVANGVVSATVVAPNCTLADGLATALMVMGPDGARRLEGANADVHWLLIERNKEGQLVDVPSSGWPRNGG
jgi:thiamine biosynthesis lipoprotein